MTTRGILLILVLLALGLSTSGAQFRSTPNRALQGLSLPSTRGSDTTAQPLTQGTLPTSVSPLKGMWGMDILISNDGFGLGAFYRREFTPDISGCASLSVSEAKDDREIDRIDPYTGVSYTPGKLNRFMLLPLMVSVQYRVFREDIIDTFRPYINAGAGPAMIYVMPFIQLSRSPSGALITDQVEFFSAIGKGHPRYTAGGFIGFGANFGSEKTNVFGINFRYYFLYLFSDGVPSFYDIDSGTVISTKNSFGGFFITLNVGVG